MKILFPIIAIMATFLSSCYKEPDLFEDLMVRDGKVAVLSVMWLGDTRTPEPGEPGGAVVTTDTVAAGSEVNVNFEYTTEIPVKQVKVYTAPTAAGTKTLVKTEDIGSMDYDAVLRNYVYRVKIPVPSDRESIVVFGEIITENNLVSKQKSATLRILLPKAKMP